MERRKFPRINMELPIGYCFRLLFSHEASSGEGFLKNISQSGMYFKCPPPLSLEDGNIGDFTIETTPIKGYTSRLKALGKIVRIESPKKCSGEFGMAVEFLSNIIVSFRS
jgi:hypothetical protein